MAYIPAKHQKKDGGEVFSYSAELADEIEELLTEGKSVLLKTQYMRVSLMMKSLPHIYIRYITRIH